jgi:alcohol dehydrogenase
MTDVSELMRAVAIAKNGNPKVLKYVDMRTPLATGNEVLVKVHATSVNPSDLLYRSGRFIIRKPMPHILGGDLAGEIVEVGDDVKDWAVGDRVTSTFETLGRERDGSYAEYCTVPADELMKLPDELDYQTAVSAGASFVSAWVALVNNAKIKKADTVVIMSADRSVGTAAVQIAHGKGAKVIAVTSGNNTAKLREIGADIVLDGKGTDVVRQVKVVTDEMGVSLVMHLSDKDKLQQAIDMLDYKGRLVIGTALRRTDVTINAMDVYIKNLSILGSYDSIKAKDYEAILNGMVSGKYKAVIDEVMPLSQAREAHEKIEKHATFGKIILVPDSILSADQKPDGWIAIE